MKTKTFKVLSIDFDFFQNVTSKDLDVYPKGYDYTTDESVAVWTQIYQNHPSLLSSVKINHSLFRTMLKILKNQKSDIPVLITKSHKDAYSFIMNNYNEHPVDLVNIDEHHDILNGNPTLDCGNWISHVLKNTVSGVKFQWIGRKISAKEYCINSDEQKGLCLSFGLSQLLNESFDAVFISRSDAWVPPHLDISFEELKEVCISHFDSVDVEFCVNVPRELKFSTAVETA